MELIKKSEKKFRIGPENNGKKSALKNTVRSYMSLLAEVFVVGHFHKCIRAGSLKRTTSHIPAPPWEGVLPRRATNPLRNIRTS